MSRTAAKAAGLLLALLPAAAGAARIPVAVVGANELDSTPVVGSVWALRTAMSERSDLASVSIEEKLGGSAASAQDEGTAALSEGRNAFNELDLERAARALETAARLLGPQKATRDEAVEALDLLAQTRSAAHDELGAAMAYARLARLDAGFRPDVEALGPAIAKAWKRAQSLAKLGRPGPLRVESAATPAAVFLGDRYVGVTPQLLPPAETLAVELTLRADGFAPWRRALALRPGAGAAVDAALEPLAKSALLLDAQDKLGPQLERDTVGTALKDLRSLLFADQAVLVGVVGGDLVCQLYDLKISKRVRSVRRPLPKAGLSESQAAAVLASLYDGVDVASPGTTELEEAEPESLDGSGGGNLMENWWFWPAVGVAATTAIVVPILVLGGDEGAGLKAHDGEGAVVLRF